ncbi:MAG: hypothetical protein ACOYJC_01595 [Christensenellales bacterium]|jgi:hypothetical protein
MKGFVTGVLAGSLIGVATVATLMAANPEWQPRPVKRIMRNGRRLVRHYI